MVKIGTLFQRLKNDIDRHLVDQYHFTQDYRLMLYNPLVNDYHFLTIREE